MSENPHLIIVSPSFPDIARLKAYAAESAADVTVSKFCPEGQAIWVDGWARSGASLLRVSSEGTFEGGG